MTLHADPAPPAHTPSRIEGLQHRVATLVGIDEGHRRETVIAMLDNNARRAPGYWIQLFLSLGIATLGLILNSTAVVIGAMLVSPLMGPILELGMGLAVGSSLLVIRAAIRVTLSLALVIGASTVLVLVFPFHEVTNEISSRTAPTALDLLVAVFCALTAAYTTVRSSNETTSAAAGTAIGIALVPPLCTVGFGLGTSSREIAGGAAMLFTANLSAIVVFSVLSFLLLGFNQVNAAKIEQESAKEITRIGDFAGRTHTLLARLFGSKYGLATRLFTPTLLLAAVFVPLRRALNEVTWEVRTREAVKSVLSAEAPGAVQTTVSVAHHEVSVHILTVGSGKNAVGLQNRITAKLAEASGVVPVVSVIEVADAGSLAKILPPEQRNARLAALQPSGVVLHDRTATAVAATWPAVAGPVLDWKLAVATRDSMTLDLYYLGLALPASSAALLSSVLSQQLGEPVRAVLHAVPRTPFAAALKHEREWTDSAVALLAFVARADSATACVAGPFKQSPAGSRLNRAIADSLQAARAVAMRRAQFVEADRWSIQIGYDSCTTVKIAPRVSP